MQIIGNRKKKIFFVNLFQKVLKFCICSFQKMFNVSSEYSSKFNFKPRLWHMRRAIASTCLCTCLKHQRRAKESTSCLTQKASRCAEDSMSKTTAFFFLSLSINVLTIMFEIKKKENDAAVLTLLTDANLKILLY